MKQIFVFFCFWHIFLFAQGEVLRTTNFESQQIGTAYSRSVWQADGFTTGTWDNGLETRTMIDNSYSVSGMQSLRVIYPKGTFGPDINGAQVELTIDPQNEVFMSYWIRFSENFSWGTTNEGGKLPGLTGGDNCSGGSSCDGTNGFSARFMWRAGGKIGLYLYHMDKPNTYGEDYEFVYPDGSNVIIKKGEWYHIAERVKINTDGNTSDGEVEVWINGKQVLNLGGLRFTSNGDKVDKLYISTFHGGDNETWCPTETCYIWFDDVKIATKKEDVAYKICEKPELGPDRSLCAEKNMFLTSGMKDKEGLFFWIKDHQIISQEPDLTVSGEGCYIFLYDSLGCIARDTLLVRNDLFADLGADRIICRNSFEVLDANISGNGISYSWYKDGVLLEKEESRKLSVKNAGEYIVSVEAQGCESVLDTVILLSKLLQIENVQGKVGEEIILTVEGNNIGWFRDVESKTPDFVGNDFSLILPEGKEYIYVQDLDGFSGYVGKKRLTVSASYTENRFDRRMKFEVYKPLSIDSITIYLVEKQDVVIRILDSEQSNVLFQVSFESLPAGECRIPLNADLNSGLYFMDALGSTGRLRHSNATDTSIHFPYKIDGLISIIGSNVAWIDNTPYYMFFYNWKISSGNTCARTPVLLSGESPSLVEEVNQNADIKVLYDKQTSQIRITGMKKGDIMRLYMQDGKEVLTHIVREVEMIDVKIPLLDSSTIYLMSIESEKGEKVASFKFLR